MEQLLEFFKKIKLYDKEMFEFIEKQKIIIDDENKINEFVGVYPILKEDMLINFRIMVPKIINLETLLMNIHEYGHAISLYRCLKQKYIDSKYQEVFPILLEKLYSKINNKEKEYNLIRKQQQKDIENNPLSNRYIIAYELSEELLNEDITKIQFQNGSIKK